MERAPANVLLVFAFNVLGGVPDQVTATRLELKARRETQQ
jgi:hypothetical protein